MMIQKNKTFAFLAVAAALMLGACADQMEPAKQAIANIESAIAAATDAPKYVPDQLAAVQSKLADLKTAFDAKDYKTVLARAPAVLTDAQGLLGAAMLKKEAVVKAATAAWPGFAGSIPAMLKAVTDKATSLGKAKKPPAGVDMDAAKKAVGEATDHWSKAQAASTAGDVESAVNHATEAKSSIVAAATAMKMSLPAAAAAPAAAPAAK
jgi:hypothetical protein